VRVFENPNFDLRFKWFRDVKEQIKKSKLFPLYAVKVYRRSRVVTPRILNPGI
jgi:hypothetical protein